MWILWFSVCSHGFVISFWMFLEETTVLSDHTEDIPGSSKKTAILLHVVTSYLIPPRPLDQCCCPMHAGIRTEMAVFFEGLSKQSDVTTLNWGKGGHASFFAMSLTGWLFFLKNPDSVRERFFGLRMCKHKLEQTTFCTCHNLNPNTLSSSKLLPSKQRSTIFFCLWLFKRKLEQIPFCTCHNPNPKTRSSSQLPTSKECASTPPEAELHKLCFAQCTYSARTVHGTVHATVHGHKTL